jgi:hypothetical protein
MRSNQLTLYHCVGNGLNRTDAISLSHQETTLHCVREQCPFVLGANVRISTLSIKLWPYEYGLAIRISVLKSMNYAPTYLVS